ncbi:MAG TPA: ABC transporter substrate-binding protein [Clostridiaceae bacterium]|nr:ABC transporter substrate-binding protein [Clostridiaceae bacterium]
MVKRLISLMLMAFMCISMIAGCSGNKASESTTSVQTTTADTDAADNTNTSDEPKPVTITVSNWPKGDDEANTKLYAQYVETMKQKYPYITIQGEEWSYDVNSFLPKAASGQLPNLYDTYFTEASKIIEGGYSADITDIVKKYNYDKTMNPDMLALVTKDNRYYGLPQGGYTVGLMYNVNVFKEAGLLDEKGVPKFPRTYDELAQTAQIIKQKTGKPGFFFPTKNNQGGWMFMNIAWAYGAEFEKKVDGKWKAVFNSPEAVAALQYVKDLKWKYDVLPENNLVEVADLMGLMGTDQVGMAFGALGWVPMIITNTKMSKDAIAMSQNPAGPKGVATVLGGSIFMFAPQSTPEQLDACIKWLEVSKGFSPIVTDEMKQNFEATAKINNEQGLVVGPHDMRVWVDPERVAAEDEILKKYQNVNMDLWNDYVNNSTKGMRPEEPVLAQELYKTLDTAIQSVLTDKNADPQEILNRLVETFQRDYLDKVAQ